MNYQEFLEYMEQHLVQYMQKMEEGSGEKQYGVMLQHVVKNNGIVLDAVVIYEQGERISPNIYLKSHYNNYQMGKPLDMIMADIAEEYRRAMEDNDIEYVDIRDFSNIKEHIVIRLVNYERNKDQLETCPHKKYLDLAVTFRYIVSETAIGTASALITDKEFHLWDIGVEELYQIALFNSMQEYSWHMESIAKVLYNCLKEQMSGEWSKEQMEELKQEEFGVNLYVLTNRTKSFGAACMLYDNVIRNFANVQEANIYILPSSVHEVMLVPEEDGIDPRFLQELLTDANRTSVGLIDLLSDNIYYYDRQQDEVVIYSSC